MSSNSKCGFCRDCGSILPNLKATGGVTCYLCEKEHDASGEMNKVKLKLIFDKNIFSVFGDMYVEYTVQFNRRTKQNDEDSENEEEEGPVVDRVCKNCGHQKMSYATLQLRSADEGQTVFFTCGKCNFKESENS